MFYNCESLISLPDISKWNTSNVINMSYIFYDCKSLKSLPDISKWNTNNVTNMSHMLFRCESLISLPDISKWNTNNVTNMNYMFCGCISLISLPDISKWNTNNVTDMSSMFEGCESLISLPNISIWNMNNVTNMTDMFDRCESLKSLPNIYNWIKINVKDYLKEKLKDIIQYTNDNEIQIMKIKDENHFNGDKDIEKYIKSLGKFDDNKFNICRNCKQGNNKFFCKNCNINICNNCYRICKANNHTLIELEGLLNEVNKNKENINLIISKNYMLTYEKESFDEKEKKNKNYEIIDEYKFKNIEGKLKEYTNDIILIKAIIEKNYNNYFHYIKIKECLIYLRKKYDYITINYNIKENNEYIKIFGEDFVKNNKNICQIIYEDEYYELSEYLELKNISNKILEIKLIGINNVINASRLFNGCESLISLPDISK